MFVSQMSNVTHGSLVMLIAHSYSFTYPILYLKISCRVLQGPGFDQSVTTGKSHKHSEGILRVWTVLQGNWNIGYILFTFSRFSVFFKTLDHVLPLHTHLREKLTSVRSCYCISFTAYFIPSVSDWQFHNFDGRVLLFVIVAFFI